MPSVVIVQEDTGVGSILEASFREEGYVAGVCGMADQCERMVAERQPDLVVVDSLGRVGALHKSFVRMRSNVKRRQLAIIVLGGDALPTTFSTSEPTITCRGPFPCRSFSLVAMP